MDNISVKFPAGNRWSSKCLSEASFIKELCTEVKVKLRTPRDKHPRISNSRKPVQTQAEGTKRRCSVDDSPELALWQRHSHKELCAQRKGAKSRTVNINTQTSLSSQLSSLSKAFPLAESNIKPENKETHKGSNSQGTEWGREELRMNKGTWTE